MSTTVENVDAQGIQWDARFLAWGKGRYHVQRPGESETVCGKEIPFDTQQVRGSIYSGWECQRCKKADQDAFDAAETYRRDLSRYSQSQHDTRLEKNRAGNFTVLRCKLCGAQHRTEGDGRGAVAYCMDAGHPAELEEVEAVGPRWDETPASSRKQAGA